MDIFDLSFEEFEKRIDSILETITAEELLQELIENGLETKFSANSYIKYTSYIESEENVWIHKNRTSKIEKIKYNNNKDIAEAA